MKTRAFWIAPLLVLLGLGAGLLAARLLAQPAAITVRFDDTPAAAAEIRVYVSGAVANPGVYPLHAGDRVVDAIDAAGGVTADADTEAVNFALRVRDEDHVHVARTGDPPATAPTETANPATQKVDINRADVFLLRTLPGVGATRAANIIASRQKDGPFSQSDDLVKRKLVTQTIYTQIKDRIEVTSAP
ncbi:MAG: helix-hairpin-helix domain-containing protein [Dehalococcoidia bacterium]